MAQERAERHTRPITRNDALHAAPAEGQSVRLKLPELPARLRLAPEYREELQRLWYEMLLIRRFEERAAEMYTRARIGGYSHLNIGEEATIVGALTPLRPDDYVISNYREHGHALVRGVDPKAVMAELFGKETGCSRGRGGSMHLFDIEKRFLGGYGIVAGQMPIACGVAMAIQYRRGEEIVVCIFGEGATNIGAFHESLNQAKLWHLPVVFLCVNNQYAMGAAVSEDSAVPEIYRKACAYDMRSERVDGMDVLAVRAVMERAISLAREQHEPSLVEAVTYRFRGHSMADPGRYRTEEEVRQWMARDPIQTFRRQLEENDLLSASEAQEIEHRVEQIVDEAVRFAEESPAPDPKDLYKYLYCSWEWGE